MNQVAQTIIKQWLKSLERVTAILILFHGHHIKNFSSILIVFQSFYSAYFNGAMACL